MIFHQPKCCSECFYIRPYNGYMVCTNPSFPDEMKMVLDISCSKVDPDAIPDWCPYILANIAISSMPKEKQDALESIFNGFSILFGWDKTSLPTSQKEKNDTCE